MPSARRVKLTPQFQTISSPSSLSFRLIVDATDANLMNANVFVLRRVTLLASPMTVSDRFDHVATPLEMTTLPVDNPASGESLFRVDHLDLTFRSASEANAAWTALIAAVGALKVALDDSDTLTSAPAVWIGTPP